MTMVYDDMAYMYLYAVWTVCPQLVDIAYACLRQGCHSPCIFDTHNQEWPSLKSFIIFLIFAMNTM